MEEAITSPSPAFLSDDLITEIISYLPVKALMRFKCVNKFFKTLITDPHFIQIHLKKSSRNPNLALMWEEKRYQTDFFVTIFPINRLHEINPTDFRKNSHYGLDDNYHKWFLIGSCNGLFCSIDFHCFRNFYWIIYFWNPATRTKYRRIRTSLSIEFKFAFGYDNSSRTYKVVAFRVYNVHGIATSEVKVFSLGNKRCRNIQGFPVSPLYLLHYGDNNGVYVNGTINWMVLCNNYSHYDTDSVRVEEFVIVSLDLSTESYTQFLLPRGFDEVPWYPPTIVVLNDCICFSHDFRKTHFVIWQMKDFGVQESWVQIFKISYQNNIYSSVDYYVLESQRLAFLPLYLSENGDTLILVNEVDKLAFIYNRRDNRVDQIRNTNQIWWSCTKNYIESLVTTS